MNCVAAYFMPHIFGFIIPVSKTVAKEDGDIFFFNLRKGLCDRQQVRTHTSTKKRLSVTKILITIKTKYNV